VELADTKMKWKRCDWKESWPNLWHYTGIYLEGLCKVMNNPKDNTCTSQALNPLPSGYKLGMITASAKLLSLMSCDFLDILQYVVCPESIKPINILKKVTYLEQWNLSPLQSTSLGTSHTYPSVPSTFQNNLKSPFSESPSAASSHSP